MRTPATRTDYGSVSGNFPALYTFTSTCPRDGFMYVRTLTSSVRVLRWLTTCLLLALTVSAAYATTTRPVGAAITCYVSTTGGSNAATATSWATSTSNLQGAIDYVKKNGGGQVWVANGLYKPGTTTASSFSLANNVAIYGGFTIGQTSISDRNLTGPSGTTLTGNLGGGINSVHVVNNPASLILTSSALLDGFVITGGKATNAEGGGMYNVNGSPTIRNCVFTENSATSGGGMYNLSSSPTLINCSFLNNSVNQNGGAILSFDSSPILVNCVFLNNSAGSNGGAIMNESSYPTFVNCSFSGNLADGGAGDGGAIYCGSGTVTLTQSVFFGNGTSNTFKLTTNVLESASITASYSLFEASSVSGGQVTQTNCLTTNTSPFSSTASVALAAGSPAINAGNPQSQTVASPPYSATNLPATDLAGNSRIQGGRVDIGALEGIPCTPPQFTRQPASGSALCVGSALSLTVSASTSSNGTVAYQWLKNGQPLSTPQNTSVLSLSSLTANDAGSYAAVATNGCISVTSSAFSLTVNTLAGFTQQPATASAVCTDATVSIAVSATGTPAAGQQSLNYQWFRNGNLLQGQNNAALTLTDVTAPQAGSYSVVVTGACNSITSTAFSLSVTDLASLSISSITLCPTQTGSLMASGCNGGTISWSTGSPDITAGNELSIVSATCLAGSCSAVAQGNVVVTNQTPPPATLSSLIADESGCPVKLIAQGTAGSFVFTGPNGYVFSTVYRQSAARQATATQVKVPGIYTLRAVNTTVCGSSTPVNLTVTVSRSCP
nr:immunoglobulin domain-containing protein [uncultured Arsenicibacter sp.]